MSFLNELIEARALLRKLQQELTELHELERLRREIPLVREQIAEIVKRLRK